MLVKFPYNKELIEEIKNIPGRAYDPNEKGWNIPDRFLPWAADMIQNYYPNIADVVRDFATITNPKPDMGNLTTAKDIDELDAQYSQKTVQDIKNRLQMPYDLYAYQEIAVAFLEERNKDNRGALIGDQPGLGKTIETLAWLSLNPSKLPALIITQASIKRSWYREVEKWLPSASVQMLDQGKDIVDYEADIVIVNYDLIWRKGIEEQLLKRKFPVVVYDEVTDIKEPSAKRTKTAKKLGKRAEFNIGLSGTPILNRPIEFYNILNLIEPTQFTSHFKFGMRYCNGYHNGFGYVFKGSSRIDELREQIQPLMIRRLKSDVLTELPAKSRRTIFIDMPGKYYQDYVAAENNLVETLRSLPSGKISDEYEENRMWLLSKLNYLRHIVGLAKAEEAQEIIKNFVDAGEKLVVFAHHHDVMDLIDNYLTKDKILHVAVDGRTPGPARQDAIDKFQTDPDCMVFVASTAMGMGITLTAASNALFVERQWTPGIEEQMEDRLHRIGQTNAVLAHYMLIEGSLDEKMDKLVDNKRLILDEVLDGEKNRDRGKSIINELLAELAR